MHSITHRMTNGSISQLSQQQSVDTGETHQIFADKHPDKNSEEDAADEPEDSEGIKLL